MRRLAVLVLPLVLGCPPVSDGVCGDGVIDAGEDCDDGNQARGDGCSSICTDEPASNTLLLRVLDGPFGLITADINNDGTPDLATSNATASVSVFLNDGTGELGPELTLGARALAKSLAAADFEGDGDVDLAVTQAFPPQILVLRSNGAGGFTDIPLFFEAQNLPRDVVAANLIGGSGQELAVADEAADAVGIFERQGLALSLVQEISVGAAPSSIAAGDIDGDGDNDLITANAGDDSLTVIVNQGGALAARDGLATSGSPAEVKLLDVNGDGDLDLVAAVFGASAVELRRGDGAGVFAAPQSIFVETTAGLDGDGVTSVAFGDIDGDGDLDMAAGLRRGAVQLFTQDAGGFSPGDRVAFSTRQLTKVALADLDGDGLAELIAALPSDFAVAILFSNR